MIDRLSGSASKIGGAAFHLDGAALSAVWSIPFAGLLLSIALLPLFAPHFWEHHFGKVAAFWAVALLIPCTIAFGVSTTTAEVLAYAAARLYPLHPPAVRAVRRRRRHSCQRQPRRHTGDQHGNPRLRHTDSELPRHDRRLHGADPPA